MAKFRPVQIKLSGIRYVTPEYPPLTDALVSGVAPEVREIPVAELRIASKFRAPVPYVEAIVRDFTMESRRREELETHVLVMERRNGSLWVYDNPGYVAAAKRVDATMTLRCDVNADPTR